MLKRSIFLLLLALAGCASAPAEQATDPAYGYTKEKPVKVGGADSTRGPQAEREFLDRLRGPSGEPVSYERVGSCCPFETARGFKGIGLLDAYAVTHDGLTEPVTIYINFYDPGPPSAPLGFTLAK